MLKLQWKPVPLRALTRIPLNRAYEELMKDTEEFRAKIIIASGLSPHLILALSLNAIIIKLK